MQHFKTIDIFSLTENAFAMLDKDWMLVAAGTKDNYNMMTASWGGFGVLWKKPVAFVFIRPQRHTYQFVESNDYLTLSFFSEKYRDILTLLGTKSGKEINKMNIEGLSVVETSLKNISFQESRLFFECKKLYHDDIKPAHILLPEIDKNYPIKDYHRMYICEIINAFKAE
jgi:flavin reductase (DIM6/NTAB) family NADH-FMN oxidoreductase RutF